MRSTVVSPCGQQPRDHEACRGTQIGRHYRRALEPGDALNDRGVAIDANVSAEALQLDRVHEAILEDGLSDHRSTVSHGVDGHELGLHVGGKGGVRRGTDRHRLELRAAP